MPYASGGIGGLGHVAVTALTRALGIELNHIPFRGSGDSVMAMQQGSVLMLTAEANLVHQYGLHPIAVFAERRMPQYPDAPTVRELGHDLVFPLWTGLYAPAGTPEAALARLDGACERTLRTHPPWPRGWRARRTRSATSGGRSSRPSPAPRRRSTTASSKPPGCAKRTDRGAASRPCRPAQGRPAPEAGCRPFRAWAALRPWAA